MQYFLIQDLKIENFFYNSSIYLYKINEDESSRENERIEDKIKDDSSLINQTVKFQEIENLMNSNIKNNKNILRNKIHSIYNSIDDEDMEDLNYELEKDKLLKEKIKSDIIVILPKSFFASNQQIDIDNFSLFVQKFDSFYFGNFIDKNVFELFNTIGD